MDEFAYFMIRLHRPSPDAPVLCATGMLERIDTGEKWSFSSTEELLRLMCVSPVRPGNMHLFTSADKPPGS